MSELMVNSYKVQSIAGNIDESSCAFKGFNYCKFSNLIKNECWGFWEILKILDKLKFLEI